MSAPGFYRVPRFNGIAVRVDRVAYEVGETGLYAVEGALLHRTAVGWRVFRVAPMHLRWVELEPMEPPR